MTLIKMKKLKVHKLFLGTFAFEHFLDVFFLKFFCSFTRHFFGFLLFLAYQMLVILLECFMNEFMGDSTERISPTNLKGRTNSLPQNILQKQ